MDFEEEMFEEHLDDEVSTEAHLEEKLESRSSSTNICTLMSRCTDDKRRKLLLLLGQHLQNFQRAMLTNRRRFQQRMRRRQSLLRAFYLQQLVEVETSFMELLPLPCGVVAISDAAVPAANGTQRHDETELLSMPKFQRRRKTAGVASSALRFYEDVVVRFSEEQWHAAFRMSKRTFRWLCAQLREALESPTTKPTSITLEKRVALALYAFATGDDFSSVAVLFDIATPSSVCKFIKLFAAAVLQKLGACLLAMPQREEDYREIREALQQASNMPAAAVGVLGHVTLPVCVASPTPTSTPEPDVKVAAPTSSMLLQTLIDDRLLFRKVQVELSTRRPTLFLYAPNEITKLSAQPINDEQRLLPCFVVASASANYPLRPWLMQPYEEPISPHEYDFNEAVDNLLLIRERAFQRLFARWKILIRKRDLEGRTMESIAVACCALHNLLEEQDERYLPEWAEHVDVLPYLDGGGAEASTIQRPPTAPTGSGGMQSLAEQTLDIRDYLARTISSTEM